MRLKPAPQSQGWESPEAHEQYKRNRQRGRVLFVCVAIFLGVLYGPAKLASVSKLSNDELDILLSKRSKEYIAKFAMECIDKEECVDSERAANARAAYEMAVLGRASTDADPSPSRLDADSFAGSSCPKNIRIVSELARLGEMTSKEAADSVRHSAFVGIDGVISRIDAENARREALILALKALEDDQNIISSIEGITIDSYRIVLPAKGVLHLYAPPLQSHFPWFVQSPDRAITIEARNILTDLAARMDAKLEPIAVEIFGGSRVFRVETSIEIRPPATIPENNLEPKIKSKESSIVDGALTFYFPLQDISKLQLGIHPPNCPSAISTSTGSVIISSAPGASTQGDRLHVHLALRLTYMPLDYEMAFPQHTAYVLDSQVISHLNRQRVLQELKNAPLLTTVLSPQVSFVNRVRALFFVLAQFFAIHGAITFQLGFTLVAFSAVFSLRRLFQAEASSSASTLSSNKGTNGAVTTSSVVDDDDDDD